MNQNLPNQTCSHHSDLNGKLETVNRKIDRLNKHLENNPHDDYCICKLVRMIGYRDELKELIDI